MIPEKLQLALQEETIALKLKETSEAFLNISLRYRDESGKGKRLLTTDSEALAYSLARMPATCGAVEEILEQVFSSSVNITNTSNKVINKFDDIHSLLDLGAGTGAVGWIMDKYFDMNNIICLEREVAMINMGKKLMNSGSQYLKDAKWIKHDIEKENIDYKADIVTASYVLNELTEEVRIKVVDEIWQATNRLLIIIEPGTPVGFRNIKRIRETLILKGAKILAPCIHNKKCYKTEEDWCHFSCRVGRTSIHKDLKGADASYEDEKFSYLVVEKEDKYTNSMSKKDKCICKNHCGRILRHPQVRKGHTIMEICTAEGIKNITISKRDKEIYKASKKLKQGDKIFYKTC